MSFLSCKLIFDQTPCGQLRGTVMIFAFPPYLVGSLVNFAYDDLIQEESLLDHSDSPICFVHDQNCSLAHLIDVYTLYTNVTHTSYQLVYGSVNYFKCRHSAEIRSLPILPYTNPSENWAYVAGFLDMNSTLRLENLDLNLTVYSESHQLLERMCQFIDIPTLPFEDRLVYTATNVIDLIGKLPSESILHTQLKQLLHGHESIGRCLVYKLDPAAILPSKARFSDVGYDVTIIRHHKTLNAQTDLWDTGLSLRIPFGFYVELVPRSSLSKSGYVLANSIGIIDRSYQGNLLVALTRIVPDATPMNTLLPFRCCQLIFRRQLFVELEEVPTEGSHPEPTSSRGTGGFGSSGL